MPVDPSNFKRSSSCKRKPFNLKFTKHESARSQPNDNHLRLLVNISEVSWLLFLNSLLHFLRSGERNTNFYTVVNVQWIELVCVLGKRLARVTPVVPSFVFVGFFEHRDGVAFGYEFLNFLSSNISSKFSPRPEDPPSEIATKDENIVIVIAIHLQSKCMLTRELRWRVLPTTCLGHVGLGWGGSPDGETGRGSFAMTMTRT